MANLILWRHADAEEASSTVEDIDRALTKSGRKDTAKMAQWLNEYLPPNTEILCSPARRCLETAAALNEISNHKNKRENHYKIQHEGRRQLIEVWSLGENGIRTQVQIPQDSQ